MIEKWKIILSQTNSNQELQFLTYLTAVIIGIQLGIYFFFQYYKIQDIYLKLNRILLSFGSFTLLIVCGALFINISRIFVTDSSSKLFFSKIGWVCAFFAPIGFLSYITIKEFSAIMNLKIVKILMVLSLIPIATVILVPSTSSPIFIFSIIFTVLGAYYLFSFQIRLIKRSVGIIKKKFLIFFIGEIISLSSLLFAVQVGIGIWPLALTQVIYFIGVGILLTGFIILFFSAHDFPPFYEFEWRENLSKLFIINQKDNVCLYYCNLSEVIEQDALKAINSQTIQSYGDSLFSSGIAGIESIIAAITDTKKEKINKIRHEDSFILFEYGKKPVQITYALIVKRDLASYRHFLQTIKKHFESFFKEILINLDNLKESQEQLFGSFESIIVDVLEV